MVDHWNNLFCWFALIFSPKMFFVCIIHILDYHQFQQKKLSYKSVFCLSKILNIYKKGFLWGRVNFWNAWEKIFGKKLKTLCFAWGVVTLDYSMVCQDHVSQKSRTMVNIILAKTLVFFPTNFSQDSSMFFVLCEHLFSPC